MKVKKYNGPDKYHFRFNKKKKHFSVIVDVDSKNKRMSGYSTSTADSKAYDSRFKKMSVNPNPNDTGNSYISKQRFTKPENTFSKPYGNWHLSEEDEKYVDSLEEKYKKRH